MMIEEFHEEASMVGTGVKMTANRSKELSPGRIVKEEDDHEKIRVLPPHAVSPAALLLIIVLWYLCATFSNAFNKVFLGHFPYAGTLTLIQTIFVILFSYINRLIQGVQFPPGYSRMRIFSLVLPLAITKDIGQVSTAMAVERMAVSFVHTVKSTSPVMTVLLSQAWFGEVYSAEVICSLLPIIGGVWLSTMSEVNFSLFGFLCALVSVIAFTVQNLTSKMLMTRHQFHFTILTQYTSLLALGILFPFWMFFDVGLIAAKASACAVGIPSILLPGKNCAAAVTMTDLLDADRPENDRVAWWHLLGIIFMASVCHYGQVVTALVVVNQSSPLTYAVANTFKRVFVIVTSILYFGNPVSFVNGLGVSIAILGIAWYDKARRKEKGSKAEPPLPQHQLSGSNSIYA